MRETVFSSVLLLLITPFLSCTKNAIIDNSPDPSSTNSPPGSFVVSLASISSDTATIGWTQAIDPDNDTVTYKILLNDSIVVSNYKQLNFTFNHLEELTSYVVKVVASDPQQNESFGTLQFTSEKYWLRFLRKIEYGVISGYSMQETGQMTKANDVGYIIAGKTELLNRTGSSLKFFAIKIDTLGNTVWRKYYDYYAANSSQIKLINCTDGYLISGDRHLIRIDNEGNLLWHKPSAFPNEIIHSIAINSTGLFYTVGNVTTDNKKELVEASICKYDANGNKIWNKRFSPSIWDSFYDIKVVSDDQLMVLGITDGRHITRDDYVHGDPYFDFDFWVLNLTGDGDLRWNKTYKDMGQATVGNIILTKEGNFVVAGYSLGSSVVPYLYLQMIGANGESIWTYFSDDDRIKANSVAETNDNALIVTGSFQWTYSYDFALYKFDKSGNKIWGKLYSEPSTYFQNRTVIPTSDGGYMINTQKSKPYNSGSETDQIYIFKTDADGEF